MNTVKPALHALLASALVVNLGAPGIAVAGQKNDKQEIGSDRQTGGPTQFDRDRMDDIRRQFQELRNRKDLESRPQDNAKRDSTNKKDESKKPVSDAKK